jgi:hypothetical protein
MAAGASHSNVKDFFTGRNEQVDLVLNYDGLEGFEKSGGLLAGRRDKIIGRERAARLREMPTRRFGHEDLVTRPMKYARQFEGGRRPATRQQNIGHLG